MPMTSNEYVVASWASELGQDVVLVCTAVVVLIIGAKDVEDSMQRSFGT